jgi:predicted nucleic acid-binding protein
MRVLVDTSVWSIVLRRDQPAASTGREVERLVRQGRIQMLGLIRQELLSGIRSHQRFAALRQELAQFADLPVASADHERAAELFNTCRAGGVQGNVVDMLICAVSIRHDMDVYTLDRDFESYARFIPLRLHTASQA